MVHEDNEKITYVIFDDDNDMLMQQKEHFIHIDHMVGITQENIEEAKRILNIES